jgi:subtilisin family serine protease
VLAVAATTENETRAEFSETAPYIAVAAPGDDISGPAPNGTGYISRSGTSFAAPFVAGVAALLRAYDPQLSAQEIIQRITLTADRMPGGPDTQFGSGVVNPYRAVTAILENAESPTTSELVAIPPAPNHADPLATTRSWALTASCLAVVLAAAAVIACQIYRQGRRRRRYVS